MDLKEKTAIVTGGSSGIGQAIAVKFANEGASVHVLDLQQVARDTEMGQNIEFHQCDVSNADQVQQVISKIASNSNIDILVNNAGVSHIGNIEQTDPWTLRVKAEIAYDFTDEKKIVSWKGLTSREVDISVLGVTAFDMPSAKAHLGHKVKSTWIVDKPPYTEPSIYSKLSYKYPVVRVEDWNKGLCSPLFNRNGGTCDVDT